ncbi:MAG: hypothetical protein R2847_03295 [Bacteroidia bacterium]
MKNKFMEGAQANGHQKILSKKFGQTGIFCQLCFLINHIQHAMHLLHFKQPISKAHYPSDEYMAAVLTNNLSNSIKDYILYGRVSSWEYLFWGPDVNESEQQFSVNKNGKSDLV